MLYCMVLYEGGPERRAASRLREEEWESECECYYVNAKGMRRGEWRETEYGLRKRGIELKG